MRSYAALQPVESEITPQRAAQRVLQREAARENVVDFARYIDIPGAPVSENPEEEYFKPVETAVAAHHRLMMESAQKIIEGTMKAPDGSVVRDGMYLLPPGSAKSTYLDVVIASWVMGKYPGSQIILTSYASNICKKQGRKARAVCKSKQYKRLFNTDIRSDMSAADEWALENGSEFMSGGILSGLTGNRGDGLIGDDLIAGRQDADSETIRETTYTEYRDSFRSRAKPHAWCLMANTRWHEDDPQGRILPPDYNGESGIIKCRDGRWWFVLSIPAQCDSKDDPLGREIGEYIWPEWFPPGHFDAFKADARSWNSLYQQRPTAEEGIHFQREWFDQTMYPANQIQDKIEQGNIYLTADYAVTADGGDYSEIAAWSMLPSEHLYCVGWWSGQVDSLEWCEELLDMVKLFKPMEHVAEAGVIRKATEAYIKRRMRERSDFVTLTWMPTTQNKLANARSFQVMASNGRVHFPETTWAERVISQLLRFPAGRYDDAVDTCGLIGRRIDQVWESTIKKKPKTLEEVWDQPLTMNQMLGR